MNWPNANWMLENQQTDVEFSKKILFSDKVHFQLSDYVNKHNCRIWLSKNPHVIQYQPMHPPRITVWCGIWSGGVIGPYFFENAAGATVILNGVRYRDMITNFNGMN